jgi:CRISPR-associated protein Cas1
MSQHERAPTEDTRRSSARAKVLRSRIPTATAPPETVPARMVNEVLYCERLMYLEWAQGEFADNQFTVDGRSIHRRADKPGKGPPAPSADRNDTTDDLEPSPEPPPWTARSVWLTSERLHLTAKIDIVEGDSSGQVVPVEYKRGKAPDVPDGAWLPERAQMCAHALLLREHGYRCDEAWIWFAKDRRRVPIDLHDDLVRQTLEAIDRARELAARGQIPPPLENNPKCVGCSLSGICLPDEVELLKRIEAQTPSGFEGERSHDQLTDPLEIDPWDLEGPAAGTGLDEEPARQLQPARDDRVPVYVQDQGARVGLKGELLLVHHRSGRHTEARMPNTSQVCVFGNVQISTQALRELLSRGIPVTFFTTGGWFIGRATGFESNNVELRMAQYAAASEPGTCLRLSRSLVASKILNCRTLLRRNHRSSDDVAMGELRRLAGRAREATSLQSLLGIEGTAARTYFGEFGGMFKAHQGPSDFDLDGRNRRPPKDPVNAMLSLAYSLLAKDYTVTMHAVGLDPLLGFYHQPRFGRPALALDLMEELRPIVADSTVITAVNNDVVRLDDFDISHVGCSFKPAGRRRFIQAYERRMGQLLAHPLFGYRISYRRLLEVQARLLSRLLLGEIREYPEFRRR